MLFKRIFLISILTTLLSCMCSTDNYKDIQADTLRIKFDGAKKEYVEKYGISIDITNQEVIDQIKSLMNQSEPASVFRSLRPVMYRTNVFFIDEENSIKAFEVNVNTEDVVTIIIDDCYYVNNELYKCVSSLIMLEEIKSYNGNLDQKKYERDIISKNNE